MGRIDALQATCHRYGPGRLPRANEPAVGAGYAAASAAACVAVVYAGVATGLDGVGLSATTELVNVALAALALPFVVPAAFGVGHLGWRWLSPRSPTTGLVVGLLGTLATYGVFLVLIGVPITALEAVSGADPVRAAVFSWGVVYLTAVETWWVAFPVGGVSGAVYAVVVSRPDDS
ncbi:hypothetical protein [Natronosalvus vescus]|uniref:hypothetical protein n=1 Tax=Natronosalvus vescus TaxID=2953881 RepID=UPI002090FB6C|nr:hypothetical protein [Natronosalvus vescus]